MRVYAFVGPSGTGKSYRAQMVAGENNISYIIHFQDAISCILMKKKKR